jgi:hypothetical protein
VLNGAGTPGLAGTVAGTLTHDGYGAGAVADASAPSAATTVGYAPGERAAAVEVAHSLKLPAADAAPVSSAAATTADAGGKHAQVVVTLGANFRG